MRCVAAGHTGKEALRLSVAPFAVPTGTAGLARVSRVDSGQLATMGLKLVVKLAAKLIPALVEDGFVQAGLGSHILARRCGGAARAGAHVADLEVLNRNDSVPAGQTRCELVQPVIFLMCNAAV